MEKFGNQVTSWKRRWFRLSVKEMQYFTSDMEREMKGTIEVSSTFKPEVSGEVSQSGVSVECTASFLVSET